MDSVDLPYAPRPSSAPVLPTAQPTAEPTAQPTAQPAEQPSLAGLDRKLDRILRCLEGGAGKQPKQTRGDPAREGLRDALVPPLGAWSARRVATAARKELQERLGEPPEDLEPLRALRCRGALIAALADPALAERRAGLATGEWLKLLAEQTEASRKRRPEEAEEAAEAAGPEAQSAQPRKRAAKETEEAKEAWSELWDKDQK